MSVTKLQLASPSALLVALCAGPLAAQETKLVSVDTTASQANGPSFRPVLNGAGDTCAFTSNADNLVANDFNNATDVFVRQMAVGVTVRASLRTGGVEGNGDSDSGHLSADGGFVAFRSDASNLVVNDVNGTSDVFLRDVVGGTTVRVSISPVAGGNANGPSHEPFVSRNGNFVVFTSAASNLVPGDFNNLPDVFVRDLAAGFTSCVSVDGFGAINANAPSFSPSISANGRFVAFASLANNLVAGDANGVTDIFVRDLAAGTTRRVNLNAFGAQANDVSVAPMISENGAFVAYESAADNLVPGDGNNDRDIFVFDRALLATRRVSVASTGAQGNADSTRPVISSNGQRVAFLTRSSTLSPDDLNGARDIYVHDLADGLTWRGSLAIGLVESLSPSSDPALSGDGTVVAWSGLGADVVAGDINGAADVFFRRPLDADWRNYGAGYPGFLGIPSLTLLSDPQIGRDITLDIQNSRGAPTLGLLLLGVAPANLPTAWGGTLLVAPIQSILFGLPAAGLQITETIAHDELSEGALLYLQVLEIDPLASNGVSATAGIEARIGW